MKRTIRKTNEEWARLSAEMRRSEQTCKEWCAQHGVNFHSLKDWEYRQKRINQAKAKRTELPPRKTSPTGWIAVDSADMPNQDEQVSLPPSKVNVMEVQIGSCVIKVSSDFDDLALTKVCQVLLKLC
jgi:hypothetical protein